MLSYGFCRCLMSTWFMKFKYIAQHIHLINISGITVYLFFFIIYTHVHIYIPKRIKSDMR